VGQVFQNSAHMKRTTIQLRHSTNRGPFRLALLLTSVVLSCITLAPPGRGQLSPPPDGCYSNFTTAEGCDALNSLSTGQGNTAIGWRSLFLVLPRVSIQESARERWP